MCCSLLQTAALCRLSPGPGSQTLTSPHSQRNRTNRKVWTQERFDVEQVSDQFQCDFSFSSDSQTLSKADCTLYCIYCICLYLIRSWLTQVHLSESLRLQIFLYKLESVVSVKSMRQLLSLKSPRMHCCNKHINQRIQDGFLWFTRKPDVSRLKH